MRNPVPLSLAVTCVCRFSYLGEGGFQVDHNTPEDRAAFLYDRKRLMHRFAWFEHVTLPAIRHQSDPDFTFLIVTGETLPAWAMARLQALTADIPQARIIAMPPMRHRDACQQAMAMLPPVEGATHYALMRLDDDDAIALDLVERLRWDFGAGLRQLWSRNRLLALDYPRGILLEELPKGETLLDPRILPLATAALAVVVGPARRADLFQFSHYKLHGRMTVVSLQDDTMFVRGVHGQNDSNASHQRGQPWDPVDIDLEEVLRDRFAIDRTALAAALRAVADF